MTIRKDKEEGTLKTVLVKNQNELCWALGNNLDITSLEISVTPEWGWHYRDRQMALPDLVIQVPQALSELPSEIGQTTKLTSLYLRNSVLRTLPPEISNLENLTTLNLVHALAGSEGDKQAMLRQISGLISLVSLDLRENNLTALPAEIGQLTSLTWLDLRGNPNLPIPPEILNEPKKAQTIIFYYLQNLEKKTRALNEAKILLVGQPEVGKTSLVRRLVYNDYNLQDKTDGINVQEWSLMVGQDQIRLNMWDFGGQEIMHATHQFFLTKRSLYLLVIDCRSSEGENRLDYWLQIIRSFGGDSPVIIVGNKSDQNPLDIGRKRIRDTHHNVHDIIETSCSKGEGIDKLREVIIREIDCMPHVREPFPNSWFAVKAELETKAKNLDFILYQDYEKLCNEYGINEESIQRALIEHLHDLGIMFCYSKDPRLKYTYILNPRWVTEGVYKIINHAPLMRDYHGVLDCSLLNEILSGPRYPADKQMFIIDMMRHFELLFDLDNYINQRFLIPGLLPQEEPDTGNWDGALAFKISYNVLPTNVISRLIVRMHRDISRNTYWRSGVVLVQNQNRALVQADTSARQISIYIGGLDTTRRNFLTWIRKNLVEIHGTIPGLEATEIIPLPDHPDVQVRYNQLRDLEKAGVNGYIPDGLVKPINVADLLDLVEAPEERNVTRGNHIAPVNPQNLPSKTLESPGSFRLNEWHLLILLSVVFFGVLLSIMSFGRQDDFGVVVFMAVAGAFIATLLIGAIALILIDKLSEKGFLELTDRLAQLIHVFKIQRVEQSRQQNSTNVAEKRNHVGNDEISDHLPK